MTNSFEGLARLKRYPIIPSRHQGSRGGRFNLLGRRPVLLAQRSRYHRPTKRSTSRTNLLFSVTKGSCQDSSNVTTSLPGALVSSAWVS